MCNLGHIWRVPAAPMAGSGPRSLANVYPMLSWKRRSTSAWLSVSWSWKGYRGRGGRAGAVEAMLVYEQDEKSTTGSPCKDSLSMDRPTAFLSCSVLGRDTQRPTTYKLSKDATVDVDDTRQAGRQVEASSGGCEKTCDLAD